MTNTPSKRDSEEISQCQLQAGKTNPCQDGSDSNCCTTVHISKCPEWHALNEYIEDGYRHGYTSYKDLFKSVFKWHNETMNI